MCQIVVPAIVTLHLRHEEHVPVATGAGTAETVLTGKLENIGAIVDRGFIASDPIWLRFLNVAVLRRLGKVLVLIKLKGGRRRGTG